METLNSLKDRFNELLAEHNLKPSVLALKLNIPKNTLCRYARGAQMPNLKMAMLLSDYFGCSIDYLLGRTDSNCNFNPQDAKPFKERFPFLLQQFKTNKYRIAKETNLHSSILYRWQNGNCSPELDSLIILADHFDCSVEYLIGRSNNIW